MRRQGPRSGAACTHQRRNRAGRPQGQIVSAKWIAVPLYLSNADQERSIDAAEAIDALERGLCEFQRGNAIRRPRIDNILPTTRADDWFNFSSMEGGFRAPGYYALRIKPDIYTRSQGTQTDGTPLRVVHHSYKPGLYGGMVFLYSTDNAEFLAFMNDGYIQHLRVAATAALGVKYLARDDSHVLGIVGSGGMARSFPLAMSAVRNIERLQVWSPNAERLAAYCEEMRTTLPFEVVPVADAEAVCRGADIVSTCTSSRTPVIRAEWLAPGTHVTNVTVWELGQDVGARITTVGLFVDRPPIDLKGFIDQDLTVTICLAYVGGTADERARIPRTRPEAHRYPGARWVRAHDWETGETYRRSRDEVTIMANHSYGTREGPALGSDAYQGIQFAAVGGRLYEGARARGIGMEFPREMFLQDIPT
jgi:alanine dehydrogenase